MKTIMSITAFLLLAAAAALTAQEADSVQTTCPVMGGAINKDVYTDYNGMRIYFCCAGCDKTFKEDPEMYIKKMKDQGITLEKAPVTQTVCPVSGEPIDTKVFTDYQGKRIYFCCEGCKKTFLETPETYIK